MFIECRIFEAPSGEPLAEVVCYNCKKSVGVWTLKRVGEMASQAKENQYGPKCPTCQEHTCPKCGQVYLNKPAGWVCTLCELETWIVQEAARQLDKNGASLTIGE